MKKILNEIKGKKIYIELANGFSIETSRNKLIDMLKAMLKENEDLNKIDTSINGTVIHITFQKQY